VITFVNINEYLHKYLHDALTFFIFLGTPYQTSVTTDFKYSRRHKEK